MVRVPLMHSSETQDRILALDTCEAQKSGLRTLVRDCSGVVAVEFLIMLGPLLLLLLGTFDLGLVMLAQTRISFAVEAASTCGAIGAVMCTSPSQTAAYGLRGVDCGTPGPHCIGVPGHDSNVWNQCDCKLRLCWYSATGPQPARRGLLPNGVTSVHWVASDSPRIRFAS